MLIFIPGNMQHVLPCCCCDGRWSPIVTFKGHWVQFLMNSHQYRINTNFLSAVSYSHYVLHMDTERQTLLSFSLLAFYLFILFSCPLLSPLKYFLSFLEKKYSSSLLLPFLASLLLFSTLGSFLHSIIFCFLSSFPSFSLPFNTFFLSVCLFLLLSVFVSVFLPHIVFFLCTFFSVTVSCRCTKQFISISEFYLPSFPYSQGDAQRLV